MKKLCSLLVLLLALPLFAVSPVFWEVRTYDDFRRGTLTGLSLTSDDRLILAPQFEVVFNTEQPFVLSSASDSRGNVYLGTGHEGKVYRVDSEGRGSVMADLAELDVFALAVDGKDMLYAATSPDGKVYRIDASGKPSVFFDPDVKYIWALAFDRQNRLIVATGDQGVIYRVGTDGRGVPFYDTDETHIISLAVDSQGNVIAGGDPKGYIYRIAPDGKAFVLHDSGMREVHTLTVAPNGTIYAGLVSTRSGISTPADSPGEGGAPSTSEGGITVTLSSESAAQQVDVTVLGSDQPDAPVSSAQRAASSGSAQSTIIEILPDGVVNTIWRSPSELVYSLLLHDDRLMFSTGTKGRIYTLDRERRAATLLVESSEQQTTRLFQVANRVYATSSNMGKLFSLSDTLSSRGTYESIVRDTQATSAWGKITWTAESPQSIEISTRTGNTGVPDGTWSDWERVNASGATASPKARFIQWKAELRADSGRSPALNSVTVPYLQQNFRPEISALDVLPPGVTLVKAQPLTASGAPAGPMDTATLRANQRAGLPGLVRIPPRRAAQKGAQSFQWTARDRNEDTLRYDLYYRGESERVWIPLKKDLEDTFYTINSDTLPDGTYVVRLVASDAQSNSPESALAGEMESGPFTIDNTPPSVTMRQEGISGGRVRIAIEAADPTSILIQPEVSVNTSDWRILFPRDGITDSKSETFLYQSGVLEPGEHVFAFRIYDQSDNVGTAKLVIRIPQ